jgi:ubiquinone/menaquinone biosynthesis C-methylase UbiE
MAFEELKERQSVMWGNGPYDAVSETLTDMHHALVDRMQPAPGQRWLDVACGTGRVTELLAATGATVVGVDLSPALVETARERAAALDLEIEYRVGDCERLDGIDDASFDGVTSAVGIMFAPDHAATAKQLARVVKPGGKLGLASWRAEGGVGDLFRLMAPFQPAAPPSSPFDWGNEERVTELLGEHFALEFSSEDSVYEFPSGESYWQLMSTSYGPTKTLVESLDDARREELHAAWNTHYDTLVQGDHVVQSRTYLLVKGTRR